STLIFDYPNLHKLAHYLGRKIGCLPDNALPKQEDRVLELPIDEDEMESAIAQKLAKLETLMAGTSGE
ncbi:MAG: hypothetical protein VSS75_013720, partial [Candidatus Parabeggiatoa sp.]|nr:hypothetical protein [Candidatus Parabeggiatoa sp.]